MFSAIFDLDGTLADTSGDLLAAANAQFVAAGYEAPLTIADRTTALLGGRPMLRLGVERLGIAAGGAFVEQAYPSLLEYYGAHIDQHTRFYPGALDVLANLRDAGWATAICTNKPIDLAERLIERLGASAAFDTILGVNSIPERKPDPKPLYVTLERLGKARDGAILIGDSETDYNAAKNAGIAILIVDFDDTGIGEAFPDAPLARDFAEVQAFLLDWAAKRG